MSLELLGDSSRASLDALATWAQVVGAIGTMLAVIVALFGAQLRRLLLRPRLDIGIGRKRGVPFAECAGGGDKPARWYHLHVSNPRRWPPISSVSVILYRIEWRDGDGRFKPAWEGALPVPWRYPDTMEKTPDIGFARDCDLCVITFDGPTDPVLRLTLGSYAGIEDRHTTYRGKTELRLALKARGLETDSRSIRVRLDWDGKGPAETLMEIGEA
jgi:hypothetical protein